MQSALQKTKYEKLFASPVLRFEVPDHTVVNAEILLALEEMRRSDGGVAKSNKGGWHSKGNLFEDEAPIFQTIKGHAERAVQDTMAQVASRADMDSLALKLFAWMNANPKGAFNAPHTHPGAHWSGVYYVSQPDTKGGQSGMIEFLDPRSDLPNWRLLDIRSFRPKAGELIVFPSYLVHWVYPNDLDVERVSIAFNATFKPL